MARRWWVAALAALVVVGGCAGGGAETSSSAGDGAAAPVAAEEFERAAPAEGAGPEAREAAGEAAEAGSAATGGDAAGGGKAEDAAVVAQAPGAQPLPPPVATNERVIREGTISLAVEAGGFDQAYARVVTAARQEGGTVVSSTTTARDGGAASGTVTVRVPAERYEDLLLGIAAVGEVVSREITAQDVSAEFVDLQSRQRNLEAQERFYLELLERAEAIPDAIALRQQLDGIAASLEQVRGRIAFLDDRTAFSTLTVELAEPDAVVAPVEPADPAQEPRLTRAWRSAQDAFLSVVAAILVTASFLLPILALAGAAWLAWRALRPRHPAPAPPPATAAPPAATPPGDEDREPQPVA